MNVELLIIGNEILIGKTQDTNSTWMAKRITKFGHMLKRITTIGDELNEISEAFQGILSREPDMVITSGGLGPTFDDMTLEGVALALNREIELNQHAYDSVKKAYENAYKQGFLQLEGMTKEREKMAYLPKGSIPLPNIRGTAPGVKIKEGKTDVYCLPGVPAEMKKIFSTVILPILKEKKGKFIEKGFILSGIGESQMAPYITELEEKNPQIWIKSHPRVGLSVEVEISITAFNVENGEEKIENALQELKKRVLKLNGKIIEDR